MEAVILVIHLIVALAIIAIVLVQPSEAGGFMGNTGGSMSNMTSQRRTGDALTRATTILAGLFFITSLALAIIAEHRDPDKSILDIAADQPPIAGKVIPPALDAEKTVPTTSTASKAIVPTVKPEEPKKENPTAPISK